MTFTEPLRLRPWLRPMPWGGAVLYDIVGQSRQSEKIGEAWLVSDHSLHTSVVTGGAHDGRTLADLIQTDAAALLGQPVDRFPLLVKILDAQQNLSVQVHPDDEKAKQWAPREGGKTEAWSVLDVGRNGAIYLGLKPGIDRKTFQRELLAGSAPLCLTRFEPAPYETYYVPAGTVHAVGEQVMVLEVQQTSDATFRLYDWGRVGADGQPRALHLEAGLACTVEQPVGAGPQPRVIEPDGRQRLVVSPYFRIYRHQSTAPIAIQAPAILVAWSKRFPYREKVREGWSLQTMLVPAAMGSFAYQGDPAVMLFEIRWD